MPVFGRGVVSDRVGLSPLSPLLLQNGYINFDKRRKVRDAWVGSQEGEKEGGVPEFWLLQPEGPFLGVCCPF